MTEVISSVGYFYFIDRMPNMKLVKILLATTLSIAAASTFAATQEAQDDNSTAATQVVGAEASDSSAAAQPTAGQPSTESAAEGATPATDAPANQ